ncbi:hypothetical protein SAPIO_CDS8358 [Scedosporium apiospermum]|uniref:Uncharacterized protein n=1 Tax=Pseudallescheria apiosperma TaxID=563466 RepID=A0A084FZG3_PSEDA|nr:uncharacterized protein SAPIO_CDS8358 [Scedosporium apiospermum]KEZ40475.1 hypothetical protein SAPIO_CDS8358 [Scedosporium apiospermum]
MRRFAVCAAFAASVVAQNSTVSLFLPVDPLDPGTSLSASVVNVDSHSHTTYEITCEQCEGATITAIDGPDTAQFAIHIGPETPRPREYLKTMDVTCRLVEEDIGSCTVSIVYVEESATKSFNSAMETEAWYAPLTITAGVEKLSATATQTGHDQNTAAPTTRAMRPSLGSLGIPCLLRPPLLLEARC